jgi:hypothetical protein
MQPAGILHERPFPGHRQSKEQGVEPSVIVFFSDISSGRRNKPIFIRRKGGELGFELLSLFRRSSSPQNDDMPYKALQSVMQVFEVLFAFRQQDWGPTFLHGHEHIVNNLFITFFIGNQHTVEFLDGYIGCQYRGIEAGFPYDEPMIEMALCQLASRIDLESDRADLHMYNRLVPVAALRCGRQTDHISRLDLGEDALKRDSR